MRRASLTFLFEEAAEAECTGGGELVLVLTLTLLDPTATPIVVSRSEAEAVGAEESTRSKPY